VQAAPLELESLEARTLLSSGSLDVPEQISGALLDTTAVDTYQLTVTTFEQVKFALSSNFPARLSLRDVSGNILEQSDTGGAGKANASLGATFTSPSSNSYQVIVTVEGLGGATGAYTLSTAEGNDPFSEFPIFNVAGFDLAAVVSGDFNRDGFLDLMAANASSDNISVFLGFGDGTFEKPDEMPAGPGPTALGVADFNGDGRLDLAVAHQIGFVSILLGNGDGTFQPLPDLIPVGSDPRALVVGDFNGDHRPDLAVANAGSDSVTVLLGAGDGSFHVSSSFAAGDQPSALTTGDFNGDGRPDLAITDMGSNSVSVFLGNGNGTFRAAAAPLPVESLPVAIVAGDFNADGKQDLAVTNQGGNPDGSNDGSVSILLGNGDGSFQSQQEFAAGRHPVGLVMADFNQDHHLDLAVANVPNPDAVLSPSFSSVTLLFGAGNGSFANTFSHSVADQSDLFPPIALAVGDFDRDGNPDLAIGESAGISDIPILLDRNALGTDEHGNPAPDLEPPVVETTIQPTPVFGDVTGDGIGDEIICNRAGQILVRAGQANRPGLFAPPIVINPGAPARAVTTVHAGSRELLAAIDQSGSTISVYALNRAGTPISRSTLHLTAPQTFGIRIAAGKLAEGHDGYDDLAVLQPNAIGGRVSIFLSDGKGGFIDADDLMRRDVGGNGPSALTLADLNGDGLDDILVTNGASGDVTVLVNNGEGFFSEERFSFNADDFQVANNGTTVFSHDATPATFAVAVAVADINRDGRPDLVAAGNFLNLAVLQGGPSGRNADNFDFASFSNPVVDGNISLPTLFALGQFNDDNGNGRSDAQDFADLAILSPETIWSPEDDSLAIYLGDVTSGFVQKINLDRAEEPIPLLAGRQPTGITVADVNGDGFSDLLVGDAAGDILTLLGNGDGTFQPVQQIAGRNASLAVDRLGENGQNAFVIGDQAGNRVAVQQSISSAASIFRDQQDGILAPGAVQLADLNGDGIPDLVVANSGGNDVLVYPGTGDGRFGAAQVFFTGTDPAGVTVADLNGDRIPDLIVADRGSNDVDVLFGQGQGTAWTLTPGPRLASGGSGPVSTTVADVNGDGLPDLLVTNHLSNSIALLPGVGSGFFNDTSPIIFPTGAGPVQSIVGSFDGRPDLLSVNASANSLSLFPGVDPAARQDILSGGLDPVAAVASDINGDGFSDLIIANNDDGLITLLLGGIDGLSLTPTSVDGELPPHPSDLALAALGDDAVTLYATNSGEDQVVQFTLELGLAIPPSNGPSSPGGPGSGEERVQSSTLLPLEGSSVPTVATLVIAEETESSGAGLVDVHTLLVLLGSGVAPGQVQLEGDITFVAAAPAEEPPGVENAALSNLLLGLEEAAARSRLDARQRLGGTPASGAPMLLREGPVPDWLADIGRELRGYGQNLADFGQDWWQAAASIYRSMAEIYQPAPRNPGTQERTIPKEEVWLPGRATDSAEESAVCLRADDCLRPLGKGDEEPGSSWPAAVISPEVSTPNSIPGAVALAALWTGVVPLRRTAPSVRGYRPVLQTGRC
jgi:hypothetical protein